MIITTSGFNAGELKIGITNCTSNFGMPDLLSVQFYCLITIGTEITVKDIFFNNGLKIFEK